MPVILPYMLPPKEQIHITESYVCSPPALHIDDETGARWTLANDRAIGHVRGHYAFNVLRNGLMVGVIASHIERRNGKIRVFTEEGWKRWTGKNFI